MIGATTKQRPLKLRNTSRAFIPKPTGRNPAPFLRQPLRIALRFCVSSLEQKRKDLYFWENAMNTETKATPQFPYVLVALCSGASSALIALLALINFPRVTGSDSMVWAVTTMMAAMVAAPAVMGIGIAYFMSKQPPRE